jgi:integrase
MPKVKLTDAAVQRYKAAPGARVDYFDATVPGFALRVSGPTPRNPHGHKSWVLFYRIGGQQKRLTLEPGYPAIGLKDARNKAGEAFRKIAVGEDPASEKQVIALRAERDPDTVENVVSEFMKRYMEGRRHAPRYIAETRRSFDNHVLPRWRGRELKSIARRDVIDLLDGIADDGKPIAANRTLAAVSKLFNWAIGRGIIEVSPVGKIEKPGKETKRERTLSDDEIEAIWDAAGSLGYPFGAFFRMALVTGQRRQEVAGMRWQDIDEDERIWTLPSEMTKAGRAHVVPLSPLALKILDGCPRTGAYAFSTRRDRPISGFSQAKKQIEAVIAKSGATDKRPNLPPTKAGADSAGWTIHDLRRTAATGMGKLRISRFAISRVLNHADSSVTGIYDRHEYLDEKRQALDSWAAHLQRLLDDPPTGDVISSPRRIAS